MRENWDDLKFVLAVAEGGSVSAAARELGVNHATVLRRIAAYEAATGITLFDKTPRGYSVPPDREAVVAAAREVAAAVNALSRVLRGSVAPVSGEIRLTTTDSLAFIVLPDVIVAVQDRAPDLRMSLLSSNAHLDLGRTMADIAIRPALTLPEDIEGIDVGVLRFAAYGPRLVATDRWLRFAGAIAQAPVGRWFASQVPPERCVTAADSFLVLRELVAAGQGCAILPEYVGGIDPRLVRLDEPAPPELARVWVASHADLARVPRIARVMRLLADALAATGHFAPTATGAVTR